MSRKQSGESLVRSSTVKVCVVFLLGVGLTWVFFWPLWTGGGLMGGDMYPYYFPQKAFFADSVKSGTIPLWNPFVGFGYPTLGESQTGVLYPPNLLLYSGLSVNAAYNVSQLFHYLIAFLATWALGRRLGLTVLAATFTATAFVYGWFPARICLEWTIIGGAWFSAILWAATVYLQSQKKWALVAIGLFLGMDLLAGHYNMAFITLLVLVWFPFLVHKKEEIETLRPTQQLLPLFLLIGCGFLIGAVQLLPSWELKSLSQRQDVNEKFSPTYGNLPPEAISQLWQPWAWHAQDDLTDHLLRDAGWLNVPAETNQVEAFIYCGLLTILLILLGCLVPSLRRGNPLPGFWRWGLLGLGGLLFATGWPTYYLSDVPGFGFFRGPGRYSLVTCFAFSLMAGGIFDSLVQKLTLSSSSRSLLGSVLIGILVADLWAVSRQYAPGFGAAWGRSIFYVVMVDYPPIAARERSELRDFLKEAGGNIRLYAPGENVPSMLGVSSLPVYLGLGPEIYEKGQVRFDFSTDNEAEIQESGDRLRSFGVTHLLLEAPIDEAAWNVTLHSQWIDLMLNGAFGRREPYYLYRLNDALGRAYVEGHPEIEVNVDSSPNEVVVTFQSSAETLDADVVLTDLNYPGWTGYEKSAEKQSLFRRQHIQLDEPAKQATVRWKYQPWSVRCGAVLSIIGLLLAFFSPKIIERIKPVSSNKN